MLFFFIIHRYTVLPPTPPPKKKEARYSKNNSRCCVHCSNTYSIWHIYVVVSFEPCQNSYYYETMNPGTIVYDYDTESCHNSISLRHRVLAQFYTTMTLSSGAILDHHDTVSWNSSVSLQHWLLEQIYITMTLRPDTILPPCVLAQFHITVTLSPRSWVLVKFFITSSSTILLILSWHWVLKNLLSLWHWVLVQFFIIMRLSDSWQILITMTSIPGKHRVPWH